MMRLLSKHSTAAAAAEISSLLREAFEAPASSSSFNGQHSIWCCVFLVNLKDPECFRVELFFHSISVGRPQTQKLALSFIFYHLNSQQTSLLHLFPASNWLPACPIECGGSFFSLLLSPAMCVSRAHVLEIITINLQFSC